MLHSSLLELAEQAPLCQQPATARGVLAEAQDLLRNAVEHGESSETLVIWFSQLVRDVLHSPAAVELAGGARMIVTGAVGRRDALPYSPIKWLTVGEGSENTEPLSELVHQVGLNPDETKFGVQARTKQEWLDMIPGASAAGMAIFADAGTFFLDRVLELDDHAPLLQDAIDHRPPPAVRTESGLPDLDIEVDLRRELLYPVIAIARWASVTAGSTALATKDRIRAGFEGGKLTEDQADQLTKAWDAGLQLQFRRWVDGVVTKERTAQSLPSIQRSLYGASSRMVSDVIWTLAHQQGMKIS